MNLLWSHAVLLARDGTAKVADVGLARILTRNDTLVSGEGTFEWSPPEVKQSPHAVASPESGVVDPAHATPLQQYLPQNCLV